MNKPALKKFATEARRELLERVELQARKIGITAEGIQKAAIESSDAIFIDGKQLKEKERVQRNKLINRIREIGFDRVMVEVSYTWFNRFTALRFMEINDYLPTKVRVLSSVNPESTEPDMMKEALNLDLELDKEYIYELKMTNNDEELFKYLMIKHCNDMNRYMPFMFETIDDYTEILFPQGLLATDSCIGKMTNIEVIPESNWKKIEVIGWLYQYYIAEEKDRVFKAKKKYKAEEIPFATQLFTPDWIVRYMVQNSLGRYWVEANPEHQGLISKWEFYLQNTEEDFNEKIAPYINKELKVEEIKCFDPAMGSGHILVYMFDVLYEIYSKSGYMEREIPRLIIENNLFGLDIDDRAYQLASFSLVMKALEYNKRFLKSIERDGLILNVTSIQEANSLTIEELDYFINNDENENYEEAKAFIEQFQDAKTIGSLIKVKESGIGYLQERLQHIEKTPITNLFEIEKREKGLLLMPKLIKQAQIMSMKFDILITNPPYMGASSMNKELTDYVKKNYPNSKADLFAAFMEIDHYLKPRGFFSSINQHAWMFLSSFEKLRKSLIENKFIDSMLHLGPRAFEEISGEVVQSTTFVYRNIYIPNIKGMYIRLVNEKTAKEKSENALNTIRGLKQNNFYLLNQQNFSKISGNPIAYWASPKTIEIFDSSKKIIDIGFAKKGLDTSSNNQFLRMWFEIDFNKKDDKWIPLNKGGTYRKWYGNQNYLIDWEGNGKDLKALSTATIRNEKFYFKEGLSWSDLTSGDFGARYFPEGFIFEATGPCYFGENLYEMLGYMNSKVFNYLAKFTMSTMHYTNGSVANMPYKEIEVNTNLIKENISISKADWDSFESSWNFRKHPLLNYPTKSLKFAFLEYENYTDSQFNKLKTNEEELNRHYIEKYDLVNELSSKIEIQDVTIRKSDIKREIKSFISYALGCIFGRYSLDVEGLIYAGGIFNSSHYKKLSIDEDNIIPVLSSAYFKDEILTKIIEFVRLTFGEESLEENLDFISEVIGSKKNETARETLRRYFINDFYKDHVQLYKKRPIYWLFTSGKEKAFNCLIYMHRYDKTTLSRIRTDYLHEVQVRMDSEKKDLLKIIDGDSSTKEISNAKKELKALDKKIDELKAYDEKLHHMADMQIEIDLDDGVAVNYAKFEGLVAKI